MKRRQLQIAAAAFALASMLPGWSQAAPIVTYSNADFDTNPATFSFSGLATYTLSSSGDIFNPAAITTAGTALVNTFGGFLGIPVQPTTNFIDRGTVVFSTTQSFGAFPTATTIPYSNGGNFLGLKFNLRDGSHVGYAEFIDNVLIGYAYESVAGASITATQITATVPEPMTLVLLGSGVLGLALMRSRRSSQGAENSFLPVP